MRIEIMIDKEQKISQSTPGRLLNPSARGNLRSPVSQTVIRIRKGSL